MKSPEILIHFASLEGPRVERTGRHQLLDITVIAILSIISGGDVWEDMEAFGECHEAWLRTFLELSGGLPSEIHFAACSTLWTPGVFKSFFSLHALAEGTLGKLSVGSSCCRSNSLASSMQS